MGKKRINFNIINSLKDRSLKAWKEGFALESAIIVFQTVERLLRIAISGYAKGRKVKEDIITKCAENEQSFVKLISYYELLNPKNSLTEKLQKFNDKRNSIMHKIFIDFESIDHLQKELENFVLEGAKINEALRKELRV